jgi:hypothetical protein
MSTTLAQTYRGSEGIQSPQFFEKTPTKVCNLEMDNNGGPFERASLSFDTTITNEEALEIKA